jgi:hypothetical protein
MHFEPWHRAQVLAQPVKTLARLRQMSRQASQRGTTNPLAPLTNATDCDGEGYIIPRCADLVAAREPKSLARPIECAKA